MILYGSFVIRKQRKIEICFLSGSEIFHKRIFLRTEDTRTLCVSKNKGSKETDTFARNKRMTKLISNSNIPCLELHRRNNDLGEELSSSDVEISFQQDCLILLIFFILIFQLHL